MKILKQLKLKQYLFAIFDQKNTPVVTLNFNKALFIFSQLFSSLPCNTTYSTHSKSSITTNPTLKRF